MRKQLWHRRDHWARSVLALVLSVFATAPAGADEGYAALRAVDLVRYLPPPPAAGSAADRADMDAVLAIQAARTQAEVREAVADQEVSVFRFADVLGAAFTAERAPRTAALATSACRQSATITAAAKRRWNRPRPFLASSSVRPVVKNATEGAYPSGHATCGYLWAIMLGEILPERRDALFARAIRYGENRVVGGVHYPSDVAAGRASAVAVAAALFGDPRFVADIEAARTELRGVLGYAPASAR
jgi:acid phosphatase (class A)